MNQPVLNESFRWLDDASFKNSGIGPGEMHKIRSAFSGIPQHILLDPGATVYRFQSGSFLTREGHVPRWWLPEDSAAEIRRLQKETKLSFDEVVRATAGLAFDFQDKCDYELSARLLVRVYAFRGPISRQPLLAQPYGKTSRDLKMNPALAKLSTLSHYLDQLFIPNLKPDIFSVSRKQIPLPSGGFSMIA